MRFRLATDNQNAGGQKLGQGIGEIFRALSMAPLYQAQGAEAAAQAAQKRDLTQSQIGVHLADAAIKNHEAQALAGRPDVLKLMGATRAGMAVPEFNAALSERTNGAPMMGPPVVPAAIDGVGPSGRQTALDDAIMTLYGPAMATPADKTNWDQLAKSRGEFQDQGIVDKAVQAVDAGNYTRSGALSAVRGKKEFTPFAAVGNTGTALNQITGEQPVSNPGLNVLFGNKVGSEIAENTAQAGSANASAGASRALTGLRGVQTGNEKSKAGMSALDLAAAKKGEPLPSANKPSRGADSTNAKAYNAIVSAVEKDQKFATAPEEEFMAEVERRAARRGMGRDAAPAAAKPAAPAAPAAAPAAVAKPASKPVDMKAADAIKAQFKAGKISQGQALAKLKELGMD